MSKKPTQYTSQHDMFSKAARSRAPELPLSTQDTTLDIEDVKVQSERPSPPPPPSSIIPIKNKTSQLLTLTLTLTTLHLLTTTPSTYIYQHLSTILPLSLPSTISPLIGLTQSLFFTTQILGYFMWKSFISADVRNFKIAILLALLGAGISGLGFGMARNFGEVLFWRALAGLMVGVEGCVGVVVMELIADRVDGEESNSRVLEMSRNVAWVVGPLMGGFLSDPAFLGFKENDWLSTYPYLLPSIGNAVIFLVTILAVWISIPEDGPAKPKSQVQHEEKGQNEVKIQCFSKTRLIQSLHLSLFETVFPIFLSTTRASKPATSIFVFSGGLSWSPREVGIAISMIGVFTVMFSLLPPFRKFTTPHQANWASLFFALSYFLIPYLTLAPSTTSYPDTISGVSIWFDIFVIAFLLAFAKAASPSGVPVKNEGNNSFVNEERARLIELGIRGIGAGFGAWCFSTSVELGFVGMGWWIAAFGALWALRSDLSVVEGGGIGCGAKVVLVDDE